MSFRLPTRVLIASGSLSRVVDTVARQNCERILLVLDAGISATVWPQRVLEDLRGAGYFVRVFDAVEANPRYTTVDRMADMARDEGLELVIGLGGGSVMDAGKAAAMLLRNPGSCLAYEGRNRFNKGSAPFIAAPTTCGTGSEVTWVSVISHPGERRKLSVKGEAMFPDDALVDPDVLVTLPAHLVAYTGMDAYTHAVEAYTCNCGNSVSDALAERAVMLLDRFLGRACRDIEDEEARFEVMRAATLAGIAFGNADVAAVHCLSESIGGMWDVPHGLANAILLAPVMRFHGSAVYGRLARLLELVEPDAKGDDERMGRLMLERIERLTEEIGIPSFDSLDIPRDSYAEIAAASVINNSNASNPRPMGEPEYLEILRLVSE